MLIQAPGGPWATAVRFTWDHRLAFRSKPAPSGERLRLTVLISPGGRSPFSCRSRAMILTAYSPRLRVQRSIENSTVLPSSYSATNATRLLVIGSGGILR